MTVMTSCAVLTNRLLPRVLDVPPSLSPPWERDGARSDEGPQGSSASTNQPFALAALPGFTLPGDTSASGRYYRADITAPFVLEDGHLTVPMGPGLGVVPEADRLAEVTTATEWLPA